MFALRLVLPILCWRTALAVRLAQLEDEAVQESVKPQRHVRPAIFIQSKASAQMKASAVAAPAGGGGDRGPIRDAVKKGFERGCIHELAVSRETFLRDQNVTSARAQRSQNISSALEAMFEAQDTSGGGDDRAAEEVLEQLGLSLDAAEDFCEANAGQPLHGAVQQCMLGFATSGRTRTRSWFRRGKGEKEIGEQDGLSALLNTRFSLDHDLLLLGLSSHSYMQSQAGAKALRDRLEGELAENKVSIKATGFSVTHTKHHCKELHAAETEQADEQYVERVSVELGVANDESGTCEEVPQAEQCPEATSPQHQRSFRWGRFSLAYTIGFLAVEAVIVGVGIAVGGGHGAALTGGLLALPVAEMTPLPFAALAGIPFFGMCACNLNTCEWNADQQVCAFTTKESGGNPYQWLPYPGTKCEPVPDFDSSNPECHMTVCDVVDYNVAHDGADPKFTGKIGKADNAVYNCLSEDGTRRGDWGVKSSWVDELTSDTIQNTPANRNAIYATLPQATRPW